MTREKTAGPDAGPAPGFPIQLSGVVSRGFGRGSKELGIPTANIPISGLDVGGHTDTESGVYFGWAGLCMDSATTDASQAPNPTAPRHRSEEVAQNISNGAAVKDGERNTIVHPMVMSIGWNPFYRNEVRSVEVHIMSKFDKDFYNALMNLSILGFIRHEKDYDSLEALVEDIHIDIDVARQSLERKAYAELAKDPYLRSFAWANRAE